jgi:hypothetical protein
MKAVEPRIEAIGPIWWNNHGDKMRIVETESKEGSVVVIRASAAEVVIQKINSDAFEVSYWINNGWRGEISGLIKMNRVMLTAAFCVSDDLGEEGEYSQWLLDKYGGTVAKQGIFIRWKPFLNIPGPGTGSDGDANVSMEVLDEIKQAVGGLLK